VIHPQLPLRMPCYDFTLITGLTFFRYTSEFGYCRLSWYDGRWVQDPRTYSTRRGWCTFTSDSNFMESSCRLQSELRGILKDLLRLAAWLPVVSPIVARVSPKV